MNLPANPPPLDALPPAKTPLDHHASTTGPRIIWWTFKLYCLVMIVFLGAQLALGITMIASPATLIEGDSAYGRNPKEAAGLLALVGLVVVAASAPQLLPIVPALVWPRSRVAWWLGMFALIAGFLTTGGWLIAIPLVFFWGNKRFRAWCGVGTARNEL